MDLVYSRSHRVMTFFNPLRPVAIYMYNILHDIGIMTESDDDYKAMAVIRSGTPNRRHSIGRNDVVCTITATPVQPSMTSVQSSSQIRLSITVTTHCED